MTPPYEQGTLGLATTVAAAQGAWDLSALGRWVMLSLFLWKPEPGVCSSNMLLNYPVFLPPAFPDFSLLLGVPTCSVARIRILEPL